MATAIKPRKKERRLSKKERFNEIKAYVSLCFTVLTEDYNFEQIAEKTGLCLATVYRLWRGDYSLNMRVNTLQVLGYAAGLKLEMVGTNYTVTLLK